MNVSAPSAFALVIAVCTSPSIDAAYGENIGNKPAVKMQLLQSTLKRSMNMAAAAIKKAGKKSHNYR